MAEANMTKRARNPMMFNAFELTNRPIMDLLLLICKIMAMSMGAVMPYKIAV